MPPSDVSVIIRSCGRPQLLARALASLDAQTLPPTEIIVVALGPAGMVAVDEARQGRALRVVSVEANRARGAALNDGLRVMTGSWAAFLDDDDTWAPTFIEEICAKAAPAASAADFGGVVCRTEIVYERLQGGTPTELGRKPINPGLRYIAVRELAERNLFTNNAVLWHRRVFAAAAGFREDLALLEDWEFNVRAAGLFRLEVLPRTLARYHRRPPGDPVPNTQRLANDRAARALQESWRRAGVIPARPRTVKAWFAEVMRTVTEWVWRAGSSVRWWFR